MQERWAHVAISEMFWAPLMAHNSYTGEDYEADSHGVKKWRMKCDCGHEWDIEAAKFPGRRHLKSCGQLLCPFTKRRKPKRAPEDRGSAHCVYLTRAASDAIELYAKELDLSFSKAISRVILDFMVQRLIEE